MSVTILKLFDVDFPPERDASDRLASIPKKVEGMPDYILEALARSRMASKVWEPTHSLVVCGALDVGAGKLFKESQVTGGGSIPIENSFVHPRRLTNLAHSSNRS